MRNPSKRKAGESAMRIVFMGTPNVAETALLELLRAPDLDIVGVYTREDKPVGRRQVLTAPPVKVRAEENGIPVFQPQSLRTETAAEELAALNPDLVVVVAYGRILPPELLAVPKYGCINLHVSLLPKYRGAAPIQWAVINGEKKTGVTIMQMDEGLDTGDILAQQSVGISPNATSGEVFDSVGTIGARLLADTIEKIRLGKITPKPQQGEATLAPPLKKDLVQIDFTRPAAQVHNLVRGANPWPLAWFTHGEKRVKLVETRLKNAHGKPGEIIDTNPLTVACGENAVQLMHVVPEGAKPMTGDAWAIGRRFKVGDRVIEENT